MNKKQMVDSMAQLSQLTKKDSEAALDAFITSVENAVREGDKVVLSGFGSWERVDRKSRNGVNPKTSEPIVIPATQAVKFKAGKDLKESAKASE